MSSQCYSSAVGNDTPVIEVVGLRDFAKRVREFALLIIKVSAQCVGYLCRHLSGRSGGHSSELSTVYFNN